MFRPRYLTHQVLRRNLRVLVVREDGSAKPLKPLYDIVGFFTAWVIVSYIGSAFNVLHLQPSLYLWNQLYWCGHVAILLPILIARVGGFRFVSNCRIYVKILGYYANQRTNSSSFMMQNVDLSDIFIRWWGTRDQLSTRMRGNYNSKNPIEYTREKFRMLVILPPWCTAVIGGFKQKKLPLLLKP